MQPASRDFHPGENCFHPRFHAGENPGKVTKLNLKKNVVYGPPFATVFSGD